MLTVDSATGHYGLRTMHCTQAAVCRVTATALLHHVVPLPHTQVSSTNTNSVCRLRVVFDIT